MSVIRLKKPQHYHEGRTVKLNYTSVFPHFLPKESLATLLFITSKWREKRYWNLSS